MYDTYRLTILDAAKKCATYCFCRFLHVLQTSVVSKKKRWLLSVECVICDRKCQEKVKMHCGASDTGYSLLVNDDPDETILSLVEKYMETK